MFFSKYTYAQEVKKSCAPIILPPNASEFDLKNYTLYEYIKEHVLLECPDLTNTKEKINHMNLYFFHSNIFQSILNTQISWNNQAQSADDNATESLQQPVFVQLTVGESIAIKDLHNAFLKQGIENSISTMEVIKDIEVKVLDYQDRICLVMSTVYGHTPLTCQHQYQHYNIDKSMYNKNPCNKISDACSYHIGEGPSLVNFSFSGRAIRCVRESLNSILYDDEFTCTYSNDNYDDVNTTSEISKGGVLNALSSFQQQFKQVVLLLIIIYTIMYGVRIAFDPNNRTRSEIILFVTKISLVYYFAVSMDLYYITNTSTRINSLNATQEYLVPMLMGIMDMFVSIVVRAVGFNTSDGICVFDASDYPDNYKYYMLWDAIDCRIARFLYINPASNNSIFSAVLSAPIMVIKFILSGNILTALCLCISLISFLSISLSFISSVIMLLVTMHGLAYTSVIFVPTVLFEKSRSFFDGWLRLIVSSALQPMVMCSFLIVFLNIFDNIMFEDCRFTKIKEYEEIEVYDKNIDDVVSKLVPRYRFKLRKPVSETCKVSPGYQLENYYGNEKAWYKTGGWFFDVAAPGGVVFLSFGKLAIVILVFYYLIQRSNAFAAEITGGVSVSVVSFGAVSLMDAAKNKIMGSKKSSNKSPAKDQSSVQEQNGEAKDRALVTEGKGDRDQAYVGGKQGDRDQAYVGSTRDG